MTDPWKFYIIGRSNRRWCWSSLVDWAVSNHPIRELPEARSVASCVPDSPDTQRCGACYCGKFRKAE